MSRKKLILDCDPGHDDALAIFLAARRAELVAITAVSGNAPLAMTLRNALVCAQLAGIDAPVHAGAAEPLIGEARHAPYIHGRSGLDGPVLPELTRKASDVPAVSAIIAAAHQHDDLWLVAVGPLTNVALALSLDPSLAQRLAGISIMGGAYGPGNTTAVAEFNIWADPEAAQVVFESGANLVVAGLDVTHQFRMSDERIARLRAAGGRLAEFAADLLTYFSAAYLRHAGIPGGGPLHDPCAVLAVTDPQLFGSSRRQVAVETTGKLTRGMMVVDRRPGSAAEPNALLLDTIDDEAAFGLLREAVAADVALGAR